MLIEISEININFPFEPYQLQRDYMTRVIEALDHKQNAVLESPTGEKFFFSISQFSSIKIFQEPEKLCVC
jgi:hypothetical protein